MARAASCDDDESALIRAYPRVRVSAARRAKRRGLYRHDQRPQERNSVDVQQTSNLDGLLPIMSNEFDVPGFGASGWGHIGAETFVLDCRRETGLYDS